LAFEVIGPDACRSAWSVCRGEPDPRSGRPRRRTAGTAVLYDRTAYPQRDRRNDSSKTAPSRDLRSPECHRRGPAEDFRPAVLRWWLSCSHPVRRRGR